MKIKLIYFRILSISMIISILTIVSTTAARAQMDSMKTASDRAASMTEKMKTQLSLTDAQYPQVQALNMKYAQKMDSLRSSAGERSTKFPAMKSIQQSKDDELKGILTSDQFTKYQAMEQEMRQKMMQRYQNSQ
jgi:hypothetical protein